MDETQTGFRHPQAHMTGGFQAEVWLLAGFTDNSSVSVLASPDHKQLLTMTENAAATYRADMADLSTLGRLKFDDDIGGLFTTAHPTVYEDGTLVNLTSEVSTECIITAFCGTPND